ncbi:hypothetical protein CMI48_04475 [Candidatus Pacearchaeota archaeon]|nr:hypothetical protein [Candidatus Pacearchaeota archaeon]
MNSKKGAGNTPLILVAIIILVGLTITGGVLLTETKEKKTPPTITEIQQAQEINQDALESDEKITLPLESIPINVNTQEENTAEDTDAASTIESTDTAIEQTDTDTNTIDQITETEEDTEEHSPNTIATCSDPGKDLFTKLEITATKDGLKITVRDVCLSEWETLASQHTAFQTILDKIIGAGIVTPSQLGNPNIIIEAFCPIQEELTLNVLTYQKAYECEFGCAQGACLPEQAPTAEAKEENPIETEEAPTETTTQIQNEEGTTTTEDQEDGGDTQETEEETENTEEIQEEETTEDEEEESNEEETDTPEEITCEDSRDPCGDICCSPKQHCSQQNTQLSPETSILEKLINWIDTLAGDKPTYSPEEGLCIENKCGKTYGELQSDRFNCGMCGNKCGWPSACLKGECIFTAKDNDNCGAIGNKCDERERCHQSKCHDIQDNIFHCGEIGNRCPPYDICQDGICRSTKTDRNNCGAKGNICSENEDCCPREIGRSFCENIIEDKSNCGFCGNSCKGNTHCIKGNCNDLKNDNENCGGVGRACKKGYLCENSRCINVMRDFKNCGEIGKNCIAVKGAGAYCFDGNCISLQEHLEKMRGVCEKNTDCSNGNTCYKKKCINLKTDRNNCGRIGNKCDWICKEAKCASLSETIYQQRCEDAKKRGEVYITEIRPFEEHPFLRADCRNKPLVWERMPLPVQNPVGTGGSGHPPLGTADQ